MTSKTAWRSWLAAFVGALFSAALLGSSAVAASATASVTTATETGGRFERAVLWRIEPTKGTPSYLFGTIHSDDPRVLALAKPIQTAFEQAESVTLEMRLDSAALVTLAENMLYRDGRTLRDVIGETLYRETRTALNERGLPGDGMDSYKPWAVFLALHAPRGTALDLVLQTQAMGAGKPVHGLETAQEQVDIFDQLALADQVALLRDALHERDKYQARIEELTRAYLARDLAAISRFIDKYRPTDARVYRIYVERLLNDRNRRMAKRMRTHLEEGNAFIAIGVAHLGGSQGVLQLLEHEGYRVSPIY